MARELGMFPYAADMVEAPYTDGVIVSAPAMGGREPYMPPPGELSVLTPRQDAGKIKEYIGQTQCIDTNTYWHAVFAGDF